MNSLKVFNPEELPSEVEKNQIINFLYEHLDEYGDTKADIEKCLNYAMKISDSPGGFALMSLDNDNPTCVVIVNKTGMNGYIPDNILVYIATHKNYRGKGIGKEMMKETINMCEGDIALHVEPDNPARFLYEKCKFTSKYIEMRHKKTK